GFVVKGRSGNYTTAEDVLICTAWKKTSQDASVGSDQTVNTYWQHIKEYFDECNTSGHFRSSDSLRQRWST
uniref:Myb/SANT-like domain-containing protein n=1 Tax=Aegilops tauschii subsp. strangulata TaxID=200361 RepID=A0A453BHR2_AEGTS